MKQALFLTILWILLTSGLPAQDDYIIHARRYGVEEGLSHRRVTGILQDSRGFIWASTQSGLNRFDGYHFQWWTQAEGLTSDFISSIEIDAEGFIWAFSENPDGTAASIDLVNSRTGEVLPFSKKFPGKLPFSEKNLLAHCLRDAGGTLYFGTVDPAGIAAYHPKTGFRFSPLPGIGRFDPVALTAQNTIWGFANEHNFLHFVETDLNGKVLRRHRRVHYGKTKTRVFTGAAGEDILLAAADLAGKDTLLDAITKQGALVQIRFEDFFKGWQAQTNYPAYLHRLPSLPLTLRNSKIVEDGNERVVYDLAKDFPESDIGFGGDSFTSPGGLLWLGGNFGLYCIEIHPNHFRRLLHDPLLPDGAGIPMRGLLEKNGALWANTEKYGQFVLDAKTGAPQAHFLPSQSLLAIAEDLNGEVLTTTEGFLLRNGKRAEPLSDKPGEHHVWAILPGFEGKFLMGTYTRLYAFDPAAGNGWTYDKLNGFNELGNTQIMHIGRGKNGDVWVCAQTGLYRIVEGEGVKERFWRGGKGRNFLPYDIVHHFYEDSEGIFWVSTGGGGLVRLDLPGDGGAKQFSRKNGFPSDIIYAAYEDEQGQLWIPGDQGIIRFDKKTFQTRTFTTADGISHNEFNRLSHTRGADGTLYFGGLNGVTAFHPKDFYSQDASPHLPLALVKFQQFDGGRNELLDRTTELDATRRILLRPGDRYFQLEFSLLTFTPERNRYAWRIEGLDKDWNYQSENFLRPGALPYGSNILRIRGQGGDGQWSENELAIEVVVLRPLWMRWWFILLTALALAVGTLAFFRWRISQHRREQERLEREVERKTHEISEQNQQLERQAEELKHLDKVKSRFFANVSHELRTPLTLMLGPIGSMLKRKRLENTDFTYAKMAQQHGQDLLKRVNEILDLSKMDAGRLELQEAPVLLLPFFQRLASAFESHAGRQGILFSFQFKADPMLRIEFDAAKLETIFNNLLSNALKFTPAGGKVSVLVEDEGSHLLLSVSDTGRGIHPDDLPHVFDRFYQAQSAVSTSTYVPVEGGTGIGLALCRELTVLMQCKLGVESTLGEGSRFFFEFAKKQVFGISDFGFRISEEEEDEMGISDFGFRISDFGDGNVLAEIPNPKSEIRNQTVLVVEDNPSLRDYISFLLAEKYHVVTAENGQAALEGMRYEVGGMPGELPCIPHTSYLIPDLIISDIMMPVMDGFQLLEKLKSDERLRRLPVVMLTARADFQDKLKALRIGVDDYLLKPFEEDELLARVENLLKNYKERQAISDLGFGISEAPPTSDPSRVTKNPKSEIASEDQAWLESLETIVLQNLDNFNLTAEGLASKMAMSRSSFFQRTKQLTGLTPAKYLDEVRFSAARRMLETRQVASVKAASYAVGFRQEKHFSREFRTRFGKLPSAYLN